ncbi:PQQ-dependent sugar dehydrogenase [Roseibium litorale]|uniref:PQQ-dependent sugar dehydrogenase n=1 Tax=Roseibium litorale TaxID=2803841 RepID=A0ABR9CQV4_9HYPH|nr:PQQ-dependent sugar dehydrogenase [Roseibium litorale]MBD8893053.1 PQQ-dependent sugar dehydrogenase [Roseibium litorale]
MRLTLPLGPSLTAGCILPVLVTAWLPAPVQAETRVAPVTVASGLASPWGLAFLPGGGYLVTERDGVLKFVAENGSQSVVSGGPKVAAAGQGGLLDIALAPDFQDTRELYMTFSESSPVGAGTSLFRARLEGEAGSFRLTEGKTVFSGNNRTSGGRHFGSRIAFARDGTIFITAGERGEGERAQNPDNHGGSVLRLTRDGGVPEDNPFAGKPGYQPEIWSMGHRNPQGAAIHPETGQLWTVEHGARGGDEINLPQAGKNYGWPVISYGRHYTFLPIGEGTHKEGMEQPLYSWDPSIAPSGMAFVTSTVYPGWEGSLLIGALAGQHLSRLSLKGDEITGEETLLEDFGERIRDVRQGPDGKIYLLTDSDDGRLIRLDVM